MLKRLTVTTLFLTVLSMAATAQDARTILGNASKAMSADNLNAITYSGSASNVNFGQTKRLSGPYVLSTTITNYTRAISLTQPASLATGTTMTPAAPGAPPAQPGTFTQNITPANAGWTQQLEIWTTPWGFLKGAAANNATARSQRIGGKTFNVVSWMTPQKAPSGLSYTVTGYINDQNMVERVETWVEHPIFGDLLVESTYTEYPRFWRRESPWKDRAEAGGLADVRSDHHERQCESRQHRRVAHASPTASARRRRARSGARRGPGRPAGPACRAIPKARRRRLSHHRGLCRARD